MFESIYRRNSMSDVNKENTEETIEKKPQPIRDTLYGRIDVSVHSVDRFIGGMLVLLVICIILGVVM